MEVWLLELLKLEPQLYSLPWKLTWQIASDLDYTFPKHHHFGGSTQQAFKESLARSKIAGPDRGVFPELDPTLDRDDDNIYKSLLVRAKASTGVICVGCRCWGTLRELLEVFRGDEGGDEVGDGVVGGDDGSVPENWFIKEAVTRRGGGGGPVWSLVVRGEAGGRFEDVKVGQMYWARWRKSGVSKRCLSRLSGGC